MGTPRTQGLSRPAPAHAWTRLRELGTRLLEPRPFREHWLLDGLAAIVIAVAARLWFGWIPLSSHVLNSMVWGREIIRGEQPTYIDGPTPHPLPNVISAFTWLTGVDTGYSIMVGLCLLSLGVLIVGVYRLGEAAFSPLAGMLAALFVALNFVIVERGLTDYDIAALGAITWAAVLELRRPKRGAAVLALLVVAGLIRPETWLLSAAYWLYIARDLDWPDRIRTAAIAAAAPVLWMLGDLLATGEPLFSITHTQEIADELERKTGLANVPETLPDGLRSVLKLPLLITGSIGLALALWLPSTRRKAAVLASVAGIGILTFAAIGVAELSLIDRYLLPTATMLSVFAAFAVTGWFQVSGTQRLAWAAGALVLALGLTFTAPKRVDDLRLVRERLDLKGEIYQDLSDLRPALEGCDPLHLSYNGGSAAPLVAYQTDRYRRDLLTFEQPPRRGIYLQPNSLEVMRRMQPPRDMPDAPPEPPPGSTRAASSESYTVWHSDC